MSRIFIITAVGSLLLEGRTFVEGDVIAALTMEDTDLPDGRELNVMDVLANLMHRNLKLTTPEQMDQLSASRSTDTVEGDAKKDWYSQRDKQAQSDQSGNSNANANANEGDGEGDAANSRGDNGNAGDKGNAEGDANKSVEGDNKVANINLPAFCLGQLKKLNIVTLQDASEFLIESNGDVSTLKLSDKATKTLIEQLKGAGLAIGPA